MNFKPSLALSSTAIVVALASTAAWIAGGHRLGWTQTRVPVTVTDEITGITVMHLEPGFSAGVELLAAGLALAVALAFASRQLARRQRTA